MSIARNQRKLMDRVWIDLDVSQDLRRLTRRFRCKRLNDVLRRLIRDELARQESAGTWLDLRGSRRKLSDEQELEAVEIKKFGERAFCRSHPMKKKLAEGKRVPRLGRDTNQYRKPKSKRRAERVRDDAKAVAKDARGHCLPRGTGGLGLPGLRSAP